MCTQISAQSLNLQASFPTLSDQLSYKGTPNTWHTSFMRLYTQYSSSSSKNSAALFKTILTFLRGGEENENGGRERFASPGMAITNAKWPTHWEKNEREKEGKTAATIVLSNWVKSVTQGGKKILCSVSLSLRGCSQPAPAPEVAGRRDTRNLLQKNMQHWVLVALWNNIQVSRHNSSQF